jgi:hypothetical protein
VWLHVDAAYGGAIALLPEMAEHSAGLEAADSITIRSRTQGLYAPFRMRRAARPRRRRAARGVSPPTARYMQDIPRDEVNFFERGPELTRGARALKLWLCCALVGTDAIAAEVRKDLRLARLARDLLGGGPPHPHRDRAAAVGVPDVRGRWWRARAAAGSFERNPQRTAIGSSSVLALLRGDVRAALLRRQPPDRAARTSRARSRASWQLLWPGAASVPSGSLSRRARSARPEPRSSRRNMRTPSECAVSPPSCAS